MKSTTVDLEGWDQAQNDRIEEDNQDKMGILIHSIQ